MKILFDKLIELLKVRQENREKLYTNFLKPAYEAFEQAHKNYLDTFQKYRDTISNNGGLFEADIVELQDSLLRDSRFHYHLRYSAINEAETLMSSSRYDFMPFIRAIREYFVGPIFGNSELVNRAKLLDEFPSNGSRAKLFHVLELIRYSLIDEKARDICTADGFDEVLMHIQKQRSEIQKLYLQAKKKLLPH